MVIDTDKLRDKVKLYYANMVDEVENDGRLSDKSTISRLNNIEKHEINSLKIITDIEHLQQTIPN